MLRTVAWRGAGRRGASGRSAFLAVVASLATGPTTVASGAPPTDRGSAERRAVREAYEARCRAAVAVPGGYRARDPRQRWWTGFDARGFRVAPDGGAWTWGLVLERYGFEGEERVPGQPAALGAEGGRVTRRWDATLSEWYVNGPLGLEHGYTLRERPIRATAGAHGPLRLVLAVRGDLVPEPAGGGRDVGFLDRCGTTVLTYRGLTVLDAGGRTLPARFEGRDRSLVLVVDERDARYPLTIDPIAQQAYLKASNTDPDDHFGVSVAVCGDLAAVGAWQEDSLATGVNGAQGNTPGANAGAVYVFARDGAGWTQEAYLKASNAEENDRFGKSVAISGDTVVVGAWLEDGASQGVNGDPGSNGALDSGAAYVFLRQGMTWMQEAYLKASNTDAGDQFGCAVAISGDTLVVSAAQEDGASQGVNGPGASNAAAASGAVYVFERCAGGWSQTAYAKASNTGAGDRFGSALAASGDLLVVGAREEASGARGVNGNQADDGAPAAGAAYVFARGAGGWSQEAYLKASNRGAGDLFGTSVALDGGRLVVGAGREDSAATGVDGDGEDDTASDAGAAYVFARSAGSWTQAAYLKASNTDAGDHFGCWVAASGDAVLVGAPDEASGASGVNGSQGNGSAGAGAAYDFVAPRASVAFRNAGANPASYAAGPARLGGTLLATVDRAPAGQAASLLLALDTPAAVVLAGGQVLLCLDAGSGELLTGAGLLPASTAGAVDSFSLAIPDDPSLCGQALFSQALLFGVPPFALSNAQDLVLGY